MAYKKKYRKGAVIESMDELCSFLVKGRWVYVRDKAYHPGWVRNFSFGWISYCVKTGSVYLAELNISFLDL